MSYSSSGAVATLWSPSNYSGATKMPVPSTARRYSNTSGTTSYRTTGNSERSYFTTSTGSYSSASRTMQTEYRSRFTPPIRSSTSVPTSYSRISEMHDATSRIANKDRAEANDSNLLSYSRSKTDNDVTATLERCGLKADSYKIRTDTVPSRFLNTSSLDSKYSYNRKFGGGTSLDLTRLSSSVKTKTSTPSTRSLRKDSLTKSDNPDLSPSPIRSLERKSSSNVTAGSSSPIEIRKSSEVWNKRLSGSYESTLKDCFQSDLFQKIDNKNQAKFASREKSEDLSEGSIILENIESEEKTLSFAEIRRKFDNNDLNALKGGFENSSQKSSHSKESKATISNGVILGVHNFGQIRYLDRNSKCKKVVDNSVNDANMETEDVNELDANNSFPSSHTFHGLLLKRTPSNIKNNSNINTNNSSNNISPAYSNQRKSPDPVSDVSNYIKKRSLPDLKKAVLSPEKKEGTLPNVVKLTDLPIAAAAHDSEQKSDEASAKGVVEGKREARKLLISTTLGIDNKNDLKVQPKRKGEKLLAKLEQTLAKPIDRDSEILSTLSRMRRSPESKPKDYETEPKVIELKRIDPSGMPPFEGYARGNEAETKEKYTSSSPSFRPASSSSGAKASERSPQRCAKQLDKSVRMSPVKDVVRSASVKESDANLSPSAFRKETTHAIKTKKNTSQKDEKETSNVRERDMNKRLLKEEPLELKLTKKLEEKFEKDEGTKETPLMDKTEVGKSLNNRILPGPSAYQNSNSYVSEESMENTGVHNASPRLNAGLSRNSTIEKGGLNGLRNIGNTCFMNSVIQCLSNTKPLLEYLLNEDYLADINITISGMKGALIKAFSNVIQELWAPNAEDKIINTSNFKSQIQRFAPRFMGYSQQDAQEFLRYLLEGLHEDVNRVTVKPKPITTDIDDTLSDNQKAVEAWKRYLRMDDSKVVDIFVGQLKSTLQCTVCGHCSVTFDPFWDLSLPVPNKNGQPRLSSCLDAFTKEEVLDGDEKPTCSKCKTRRKCTKSFSIQKFPKILVLHLKRFSTTERYRGKLSVTVDFPLSNLDLSPYAANRGQGCTYNLYAISNHSGTAFSGHYTAYCKHPYTGNWHEYNDSGVSSLSSRSVVSTEAYVLFYELATQTSHL